VLHTPKQAEISKRPTMSKEEVEQYITAREHASASSRIVSYFAACDRERFSLCGAVTY